MPPEEPDAMLGRDLMALQTAEVDMAPLAAIRPRRPCALDAQLQPMSDCMEQ